MKIRGLTYNKGKKKFEILTYRRLLDQTNYKKSLRQMPTLLFLLDYEVDFVLRKRKSVLRSKEERC